MDANRPSVESNLPNRREHEQKVSNYLRKYLFPCAWSFTLPAGTGHETYFAEGRGHTFFVKIGASSPRYEILASEGLTPEVVSAGRLEGGTPVLVQRYVAGRSPARRDYQAHLDRVARIVQQVHHNSRLLDVLRAKSPDSYAYAALQALTQLRDRWELYKPQAPDVAPFVDDSLNRIALMIPNLAGGGLVASHNDICNANWILTDDSQLYLVDLEQMAANDPACDLGVLLWWYYPPVMRQRFLEISGCVVDENFRLRMHVNRAIHLLRILLPRMNSFDTFVPASFGASLTDFRAALAGEENPQGYD